MKKFVITATILILLAAGFFGYSLYRYMKVTNLISPSTPDTAVTVAPTSADASAPTTADQAQEQSDSSGGVFASGYDKAKNYVDTMSKEQMVGQLILGVCADSSTAADEINKYSLSGMLFETANFQGMTTEQVTAALHTAASGAKIKPILAAQEEGGSYTTVSDLSSFTEYDFNSIRVDFAAGGLQAVEKSEDDKATMLKTVGFNLNLAPVVDMSDSSDQVMYSRSIGTDVDTVSAYAEYAAKFSQSKGVSIALKHFPGYGTVQDGSYTESGAILDERAAETIRNNDYQPFKKGVQAGARFVMVSNAVVKNIDSAHTAALSPVIHNELRGSVGFTGIIMTELLDGADYSAYSEGKKTAVQAVLAGNDIILVRDYATAYSDILAAVNDGTISDAVLKDACTRVMAYKYSVGLMS